MRINMVLAWCTLAALVFSVPALVSVVHYFLHAGRTGKSFHKTRSMLCPYLVAAGFAFLCFMREFYSPQAAYLLEMKQDEDADESDQGDAETLTKQLTASSDESGAVNPLTGWSCGCERNYHLDSR